MKPVTILTEPLTLALRDNSVDGFKKGDHVHCLQYHTPSNKAWIDAGDVSGKKIKWREIPLSSLQYLDNHPEQENFDEEIFRWHMDKVKEMWAQDPFLTLNSQKNPALTQLTYRNLSQDDKIQLKSHLTWMVENGAEINSYEQWSNLFTTSTSDISYFYHYLWDLNHQRKGFTPEDLEKLYDQAIHKNVFALGFMISKGLVLPYEKMIAIHQDNPRHYDQDYRETFSASLPTLPFAHEVIVNLSRFGTLSAWAIQDAQILLPFLFKHTDWLLEDAFGNTVLKLAQKREHNQVLALCESYDISIQRAGLDHATQTIDQDRPRASLRRM